MKETDRQSLPPPEDLGDVDEAAFRQAAAAIDPEDSDSLVYFGFKVEKAVAALGERVAELGAGPALSDASELLDRMLARLSAFDPEAEKVPWWGRLLGRRGVGMEAQLRQTAAELDRLASRLQSLTNPLLTEEVALGRVATDLRRHIRDLDAHLKAGLARLDGLRNRPGFRDLLHRLEDMSMARTIAGQNLATIQVMRANRKRLVERIDFLLDHALPLWHRQAQFAVEYLAAVEGGKSVDSAVSRAVSFAGLSEMQARQLMEKTRSGKGSRSAAIMELVNQRLSAALTEGESPNGAGAGGGNESKLQDGDENGHS